VVWPDYCLIEGQGTVFSQHRVCYERRSPSFLVSIGAQIGHLETAMRGLQAPLWRTPAERTAILDAMLELAGEIEELRREERRLERALRADDQSQQP
jgi:hypothetical protein